MCILCIVHGPSLDGLTSNASMLLLVHNTYIISIKADLPMPHHKSLLFVGVLQVRYIRLSAFAWYGVLRRWNGLILVLRMLMIG